MSIELQQREETTGEKRTRARQNVARECATDNEKEIDEKMNADGVRDREEDVDDGRWDDGETRDGALRELIVKFTRMVRTLRRDAARYKEALDVTESTTRRRLIAGRCRDIAQALDVAHALGAKALAASDDERTLGHALANDVFDALAEEFNAFQGIVDGYGLSTALPSAIVGEAFSLESHEADYTSEHESTLEDMKRARGIDCSIDDVASSAIMLDAIILRLDLVERDAVFKSTLMAEVRSVSASQKWSLENFAYGSTPYSSWARLHDHDSIRNAVSKLKREGYSYVVWGSSCGWLVFYASATFRINSVGYEILQTLHNTATRALDELSLAERSIMDVKFYNKDMLASSLDSAGIVLLTSCCWDNVVHEAAAHRLACDLPSGAIVIDYGDRLSDYDEFGKAPVHTDVCPTSWNPKQKFYVYQKRAVCPMK